MGDGSSDTNQLLKEFYIPDYIVEPDAAFQEMSYMPECPVIVFINSKSGGQLGGDLLKTYRTLLNSAQVFDLGEQGPDKVLHKLYGNLQRLKASKDGFVSDIASHIEKKLRIIVAGGDGTAGWILGVVCDLKLAQPPPVATVPLGTGNNLPFSFGWGKKNPGTDKESVRSFLNEVKKAKEMKIDSWHVLMRMKAPEEGACDPIAPLELPHSLHAFKRVSHTDLMNENHKDYHASLSLLSFSTITPGSRMAITHIVVDFGTTLAWGWDAQVSYAFHSERKLHPEKFKNQMVNQSTYAKIGSSQGWFCASLFHPSSCNIAQLANVKIMKKHGHWEDLHIPRSIRSIICLNLPSFSGGLNPWGTPNSKKKRDRDLTAPFVDDGLLEVVGFRDGWHGLVLLAPKGHGTRLAQAHRVRFEFHKGAADDTYMRMDGEPWKQPLPNEDDTVVVEISHLGQVNMLATHGCIAKSFQDPEFPHVDEEEEDYDSMGSEDESEGKRKFGAADTFKIPIEVDLPAPHG